MRRFLLLALLASGCSTSADSVPTTGRFRAVVWADNWFSFSLGDTSVFEDSVPFTTERSFNKESFGFDGRAWPAAVEYAPAAIDPKMGYDEVDWAASARLIWSSSLKQDNTLLCRLVVNLP